MNHARGTTTPRDTRTRSATQGNIAVATRRWTRSLVLATHAAASGAVGGRAAPVLAIKRTHTSTTTTPPDTGHKTPGIGP